MLASTVSTFAGLIIGLIVLFIAILAVLMPVFVYLIYLLLKKIQTAQEGYTSGINHMLLYLHNIQMNTKPEPIAQMGSPDIEL